MTDTIDRLPNQSQSPLDERITSLRASFPEVFREGKVDFDVLKRALGEHVHEGKERFGLTWPGKADCMRVIAEPSAGTLIPVREESVNFDSTENLIIEGDNLEVLKILQKSYYGKVKLIYIDPPYNTGNEFIYPDNFREGLQDYLRYSGQAGEDGLPLSTSLETLGRTHAKWLRMMYPRIFLSRNLLCDDGVLLVSIDDKEAANLRLLLDEVFGEDSFVTQFVWNNEGNVDQQSKIKGVHEYVMCYARNPEKLARPSVIDPNIEETSKLFNDTINNTLTKNGPANPESTVILPSGFPAAFEQGDISQRDDRWPHLLDPVHVKGGKVVSPARVRSGWSSRNLLDLFLSNGFQPIADSEGKQTWFALTETGAIYIYKKRMDAQGHVLSVLRNVGTSKATGKQLAEWGVAFSYPKPIRLIEYLVQIFTPPGSNDLVMDFFAGSGTTAHAVMRANMRDDGHRNFILVQISERRSEENLCALTRRGVASAGAYLSEQPHTTTHDFGFRSMRLASSNVKHWHLESDSSQGSVSIGVDKQLAAFTDNLVIGRSADDLLTEVLLRDGYSLTARVEKLTLADKDVYSVEDGTLLVCLDRQLTLEVINAMVQLQPAKIVCLDAGFHDDDTLKVNAVHSIKARSDRGESTIVFRVI